MRNTLTLVLLALCASMAQGQIVPPRPIEEQRADATENDCAKIGELQLRRDAVERTANRATQAKQVAILAAQLTDAQARLIAPEVTAELVQHAADIAEESNRFADALNDIADERTGALGATAYELAEQYAEVAERADAFAELADATRLVANANRLADIADDYADLTASVAKLPCP